MQYYMEDTMLFSGATTASPQKGTDARVMERKGERLGHTAWLFLHKYMRLSNVTAARASIQLHGVPSDPRARHGCSDAHGELAPTLNVKTSIPRLSQHFLKVPSERLPCEKQCASKGVAPRKLTLPLVRAPLQSNVT
jgi:hypothetical protein